MDDTTSQNASFTPQRDEQPDAETTRRHLMKSLSFEQKLAWLDWAYRQVVAKYGLEAARQNDSAVIDPPRFEVEHFQFIQRDTAEG